MTGSPLGFTEEEEGEAAIDQSSLPAIACRIIVLNPVSLCPIGPHAVATIMLVPVFKNEHHLASPERGNIKPPTAAVDGLLNCH